MLKKVLLFIILAAFSIGLLPHIDASTETVWIRIEAESVSIYSPMQIKTDSSASGGNYIVTTLPALVNSNNSQAYDNAVYTFTVPSKDVYNIWVRAKAPHRYADSIFFNLNGLIPEYENLTVAPFSTDWKWYNLKTRILEPGQHSFAIRYRELDVPLDMFVVTNECYKKPCGFGNLVEAEEENIDITFDEQRLDQYVGQHPKLFVDSDKVQELRQKILNNAAYKAMWNKNVANYDGLASQNPTEYYLSSGYDDGWQRSVAYKTASLAAAYLYTGQTKYSTAAERWAVGICSYPTWGRKHFEGIDLAANHNLFALSLVYDWCYDVLSESARQTIRENLYLRGKMLYVSVKSEWRTYWTSQMLQNHYHIGYGSLGMVGLALVDEYPEAKKWIEKTVRAFDVTFDYVAHDGASVEGYGYLMYGLEMMLSFADNAERMINVNYFDEEWLKAIPEYALHLSLPKNGWSSGSHVDIADSDRDNANFVGPDYILRKLASLYNDGRLQYLAGELDRNNLCNTSSAWYNIIWFDENVTETGFSEMSDFYWFDDIGIVAARSGWNGSESLLVYKNGPYIGHKSYRRRQGFTDLPDWGTGHTHPDANSFVVFGNDGWLLKDDGYSPKYTENHNTLLVNGTGQAGEGSTWLSSTSADGASGEPTIFNAYSNDDFTYMVGEGAGAYNSSAGLVGFSRQILFIKPSALIVIDKMKTDSSNQLELRFFPEAQSFTQSNGVLTFNGDKNKLSVSKMYGDGYFRAEDVDVKLGRNGVAQTQKAVRITKDVSGDWTNITAFAWSDASGNPVMPAMTQEGNNFIFTANGKSFIVDTVNLSAYIQPSAPKSIFLQYKANGLNTSIDRLKAGDSISVNSYVANTSDEEIRPVIALTVYKDGSLSEISLRSKGISPESGDTLKTLDMNLPEEFDENWEVKAFVWDSLDFIRPLHYGEDR